MIQVLLRKGTKESYSEIMVEKLACESQELTSHPAKLGGNVPDLGNNKYKGSR